MPKLNGQISDDLLIELTERATETGETIDRIVTTASTRALEATVQPLFQVSMSGDLVEGICQKVVVMTNMRL